METLQYNLPILQTLNFESLTDLNNYLRDNTGINIMHINIRSLSKNFDNLKLCISTMLIKPDLIICTETFKIQYPNFYEIEGYVSHYVNSEINRNDGSCVFIKKEIKHSNYDVNIGKIKAIYTELFTNYGKLYITSFYRSHGVMISDFIQDIHLYLKSKSHLSNHFIIGDMNIDLLKENNNVHEYLNNYLEYGYNSLINIPTRITTDTISCIDHIFAKYSLDCQITPIVSDLELTDHLATMLSIHKCSTLSTDNKISHLTNKLNFNELVKRVENIDWNSIYNEKDVNLTFDSFVSIIEESIEAATTKVRRKNKNKPRKDWITKGLIISCKNKNLLYKRMKSDPTNFELKAEYNNYKNKLDILIQKAKITYFNERANELSNNAKALWKLLNKKINKSNSNKRMINQLHNDTGNEVLEQEIDIANQLNKFFAEIGTKMATNVKNTNDHGQVTNHSSIRDSIFLTPTDETEILNIINKMDTTKSAGVDKISVIILKKISTHIVQPFTHIVNKSISEGIFPNIFKKAEIIPIYKSGDPKNATNYRPISLISNLSKIFETLLKIRINSFLSTHNIINSHQFGFQKNKKTEDALKCVVDQLYEAIDNNKPCLTIFLDLAKAFDTVNHRILLEKLFNYGFRGTAHKLIKSYLTDRKHVVRLNNSISSECIITCGVPQGTVLGPIFFILYMNDLFEIMSKGEIVSFADDTSLIIKGDSWKEVKELAQMKITLIAKWLNTNYLTLNVNKTVYITYGSYTDSVPRNFDLQLHSEQCIKDNCTCPILTRVESAKYLGVHIDCNLKWKTHITEITKKLRYLIYIFYKIRNMFSEKQLIMIYYALFWSIATYGIIIWGGAYDRNIKPLEDIQKRILKLIYNKSKTYSSDLLFKENKIISIRKYFLLKSVLSNFNTLRSIFLNHTINNKRCTLLVPPIVNKEIGRQHHKYISYKIYNLLNHDLKILTYECFYKIRNKTIRDFLIDLSNSTVSSLFKPLV